MYYSGQILICSSDPILNPIYRLICSEFKAILLPTSDNSILNLDKLTPFYLTTYIKADLIITSALPDFHKTSFFTVDFTDYNSLLHYSEYPGCSFKSYTKYPGIAPYAFVLRKCDVQFEGLNVWNAAIARLSLHRLDAVLLNNLRDWSSTPDCIGYSSLRSKYEDELWRSNAAGCQDWAI